MQFFEHRFLVSAVIRTVAAMVLLAAALVCPAAAVQKDQPGLISQEDIFTNPPFAESHASTVLPLKDGGLLVAYFAGTKEMNPDVGIWVSRYENGKWLPPVEVANGILPPEEAAKVKIAESDKACARIYGEGPIERVAAWNPVLFRMKDGSIALFYKLGTHPQTWWGMRIDSHDEGRTWSKPQRLPDGIYGPIKNKPVRLADGSILSPTSVEDADGWRIYFERSSDEGRTWEKTACVSSDPNIHAIQPSVLVHPNGVLQAVGRTRASRHGGFVFQTFSEDNGHTWSRLTSTPLPNNNSGTDAVTLKDGRHLIVYNHTNKTGRRNRTPLNVSISPDGVRWFGVLTLEDAPVGEFSYPAVVQSDDGLVHIVYTWNCRRIRHVVADPSKFKKGPPLISVWNN